MVTRKLHLPYLFGTFSRACFQGHLTLKEGEVQRTVLFHAGNPVHVISRPQDETLGRLLLEEGKITNDQYDRMLQSMVNTPRRAGEILVSMGVLQPHEVFQALEFQTRKKLLHCFRMKSFTFKVEEEGIPPELLVTHLDAAEIIFHGIQENYSLDWILDEFPVDETTAICSRSMPPRRPVLLGPREGRIYRALAGGSTIVELKAIESRLPILMGIVYGLHALELVEVEGLAYPETKQLDLRCLDGFLPEAVSRMTEDDRPPITLAETELQVNGKTLQDLLQESGAPPKLAEKVLSLAQADLFSVLGIGRDADSGEVQKAFYQLLETFRLYDVEESYPNERDRKLANVLLDRATAAFRELSETDSRQAYLEALQADSAVERRVSPRILADVKCQKGELALGTRRFEEAARLFQEAIGIYPDERYFHLRGLAAYMQAVDETPDDSPLPASIRDPFVEAISLNPGYDPPYFYMGLIARRDGKLDDARNWFEHALACNPANVRARRELQELKKLTDDES